MAKLKTPLYAGHNAGKNYFAKMMRISDIVVDPEISKIFVINARTLEEIYEKMLSIGFDESQPLVLQKGTNILLDGHTRLQAAIKAGFNEVPIVEKEFESRDDAVMYTFERQSMRRNLTGAEILTVAQVYLRDGRKKHDGKGRQAELLAKLLNVGVTTLYQAIAIEKNGTEEIKEKVKSGNMSLKQAYNQLNPKADIVFHVNLLVNETVKLPDSVRFLKSALEFLAEHDQYHPATLLLNHFLRKNEREAFLELLPEEIKVNLEKPIATLV
jgi:hypothetical protein